MRKIVNKPKIVGTNLGIVLKAIINSYSKYLNTKIIRKKVDLLPFSFDRIEHSQK